MLATIQSFSKTFIQETALLGRWAKARIFNVKTRDQRVFVIKNFLPEETFSDLQALALSNRDLFFRKTGLNRAGAALGRHELLDSSCADVVEGFINDTFLAKVRAETSFLRRQPWGTPRGTSGVPLGVPLLSPINCKQALQCLGVRRQGMKFAHIYKNP